jgi:type IV fimbrial biogenesis protein FimT
MSRRNRLVTYSNDVIATINLARSEAIRRGAPVAVCHSGDGTTCSGTWSDGWIVFVDANGDGDKAADPDDPILRTHGALSSKYTLGGSANFVDHIIYGGDGAANDFGVFAICHDTTLEGARAVIVTRLRPRTARDTDNPQDGIPNTDTGNLDSCTDPSA